MRDKDCGQRAFLHFDPGVSSLSQKRCVHSPRHARHATRGTKAYKHNKPWDNLVWLSPNVCVLVFQVSHGPTLKGMTLLSAHFFACEKIFGLWAQNVPVYSGRDFNFEARYGLFGWDRAKEWKMNECRCDVLALIEIPMCVPIGLHRKRRKKFVSATQTSHCFVTLRTGPLRVQEHFNNAYMPTLHVMHQANLLMPPNKFHCCTAGNVQSHSCVGRGVILKLFLGFHFITPQCHLYVLLYNMWFIKESIPGSCRNNIRETGRNQRSLCFLSGVLTVIPMCPLRGKSYSTWAPHHTNNSLFDLRWKSSAWFKAVFFKDIDG